MLQPTGCIFIVFYYKSTIRRSSTHSTLLSLIVSRKWIAGLNERCLPGKADEWLKCVLHGLIPSFWFCSLARSPSLDLTKLAEAAKTRNEHHFAWPLSSKKEEKSASSRTNVSNYVFQRPNGFPPRPWITTALTFNWKFFKNIYFLLAHCCSKNSDEMKNRRWKMQGRQNLIRK